MVTTDHGSGVFFCRVNELDKIRQNIQYYKIKYSKIRLTTATIANTM